MGSKQSKNHSNFYSVIAHSTADARPNTSMGSNKLHTDTFFSFIVRLDSFGLIRGHITNTAPYSLFLYLINMTSFLLYTKQ